MTMWSKVDELWSGLGKRSRPKKAALSHDRSLANGAMRCFLVFNGARKVTPDISRQDLTRVVIDMLSCMRLAHDSVLGFGALATEDAGIHSYFLATAPLSLLEKFEVEFKIEPSEFGGSLGDVKHNMWHKLNMSYPLF